MDSDLFRYDLTDVTKEVLQYKFTFNYFQLIAAYNRKDLSSTKYLISSFQKNSLQLNLFDRNEIAILTNILSDTEWLLASDRRFLLGNWIHSALQFAQTDEEIYFYNFNAKLQISIWGTNYTPELFDYGNKFWSGMIQEYVHKYT